MPQVCKNCGSSDIDNDATRGGAVCTNCGSVVEDNVIVSELEFAENSAGGASLIGQFVSAEGERHGFASGLKYGNRDSRQVILDRGRNTINQLGSQLRLSQHSLDAAFMFYKLAVTKRLTCGRRTIHVIGACLYLVCRTEHTAHLLIDVCDATQVDIFTLGRTFLTLSRELCIEIPTIDPSLYIHRFASKLRFGDKENEVAMTALRLLARMKRDWMATGRRPSGLCGAALLVAGKLHGFSTTMKDIIRVVRLSSTTIANRLTDFSKCPSSKLTIEEFKKVDLEEEMDPPAYMKARHRTKQPQIFGGDPEFISHEALSRVNFTKNQIDLYMERRKEIKQELQERQRIAQEIRKRKADEAAQAPSKKLPSQADEATDNQMLSPSLDPTVASENTSDVSEQGLSTSVPSTDVSSALPVAESVDISGKSEKPFSGSTEPETDELDLDGLDDDELDNFLLTGEEIELKTKLWMQENGEFMVELKAKEEQRAKEEAEKKTKVRKYQKRPKKEKIVAGSADEAIINMLSERKLSAKINYDVLKDLTSDTGTTDPVKSEPSKPTSSSMDDQAAPNRPLKPNLKRSTQFARKLQPKTTQNGRLASLKREKPSPIVHKVHFTDNIEDTPIKTLNTPHTSKKSSSESTPCTNDTSTDNLTSVEETPDVEEHDDDHEDDYYRDDEHEPTEQESELSASQLFAKDIGNEDYDGYDYGGYEEDGSFF